MKMRKKYILLAIIIIAIGLYLTHKKSDQTYYNLPNIPKIRTEDLTKIVIRKADTTLTLEKNSNRWQISPKAYLADQEKVADIIETIGNLNIVMLISELKNYVIYGLDDRNKITVTAYEGDTILREFEIGNTGPSRMHTFVKLTDDERVYYAKDSFRSSFDLTLVQLRDKTIMRFDQNKVSNVLLGRE